MTRLTVAFIDFHNDTPSSSHELHGGFCFGRKAPGINDDDRVFLETAYEKARAVLLNDTKGFRRVFGAQRLCGE